MMRNLFVAGSLVDPKLLRVVGQWSRAVVVGHAASRMLWLIFLRHSMRISCLPASSCLTAPHHFIVVSLLVSSASIFFLYIVLMSDSSTCPDHLYYIKTFSASAGRHCGFYFLPIILDRKVSMVPGHMATDWLFLQPCPANQQCRQGHPLSAYKNKRLNNSAP
jgi:hypothetical protein